MTPLVQLAPLGRWAMVAMVVWVLLLALGFALGIRWAYLPRGGSA